jgi:hypothetical protein
MKKVIVLVVIVAIGFFGYDFFSRLPEADEMGNFTIILVDENGDIVHNEVHEFYQETGLFDVLDQQYRVGCANLSYQIDETCETVFPNGHVLLKIDDIETDWYGSYIQIYVNDLPSEYGIDQIMVNNGDVYKFVYVDLGGGSE